MVEIWNEEDKKFVRVQEGSALSGFWGHLGVKGQLGGSAAGDGGGSDASSSIEQKQMRDKFSRGDIIHVGGQRLKVEVVGDKRFPRFIVAKKELVPGKYSDELSFIPFTAVASVVRDADMKAFQAESARAASAVRNETERLYRDIQPLRRK